MALAVWNSVAAPPNASPQRATAPYTSGGVPAPIPNTAAATPNSMMLASVRARNQWSTSAPTTAMPASVDSSAPSCTEHRGPKQNENASRLTGNETE